jgi:hypothetical protein
MGVSGREKGLCREARGYYYDSLCRNGASVPEAVVRHIEHCPFCRGQIRRLGEAVARTAHPAGRPDRREQGSIQTLGRHFELLGQPVTCSHVKRFWPDLLSPSREIRIPTPITVHVEHCPQCRADLAALRGQRLTGEPLERLSRFCSESCDAHPLTCREARPAAAAWADFSLSGASAEALKHVSTCRHCRSWVYRRRAQALRGTLAESGREHTPSAGASLACEAVSPAELFDFVLPYPPDAEAVHESRGRRDTVAAHVRTCRRCRQAIQELHRTVYAIAGRADSDVQTVCRPATGGSDASGNGEAIACRYPLKVQALHVETGPAILTRGLSGACDEAGERAPTGRKARSAVKAAVAAAAVIAVAVLFLVNAPTVTGTTVGDLSKALERAANVHVATWYRDHPEPGYELWLARDLNVLARRTGIECVVYDLGKGLKTVIDRHSGPATSVQLARQEYDGSRRLLAQYLAGTIFANASPHDGLEPLEGIPNAKHRVGDPEPLAAAPPGADVSVYELKRSLPSHTDRVVWHRWRVFIDPATRLPVRIESFRQETETEDWRLVQTTEFNYLSRPEMESALKALAPSQ